VGTSVAVTSGMAPSDLSPRQREAPRCRIG
jgi:hypothetical protein